jgi:phosphosulfolactate synthase
MNLLETPKRTTGMWTYGLASIIDLGISIGELKSVLDDYHQVIDIAKIGMGSAYVTPNLKQKVDLYKQFQIKPYCGGTLFEKCYQQRKLTEYFNFLYNLGIEWVEISNGTLDISLSERLKLISEIKKDFHIIAEVGSKDSNQEMPISEWKEEIRLLLEAGSEYVITEGRDSGTSGIYQKNGNLKSDLISELVKDIDSKKIFLKLLLQNTKCILLMKLGRMLI